MSRRRSHPVIYRYGEKSENAFTWFFAGLFAIALVAGLIEQLTAR